LGRPHNVAADQLQGLQTASGPRPSQQWELLVVLEFVVGRSKEGVSCVYIGM
jgi:hypothetical protein